jgi:hypothetical protein
MKPVEIVFQKGRVRVRKNDGEGKSNQGIL